MFRRKDMYVNIALLYFKLCCTQGVEGSKGRKVEYEKIKEIMGHLYDCADSCFRSAGGGAGGRTAVWSASVLCPIRKYGA